KRINRKLFSITANTTVLRSEFFVYNATSTKEIIGFDFKEVTTIEIQGKCLKIHTINRGVINTHIPIASMEAITDGKGIFFKVHRSFIISTNFIESIQGDIIKMRYYKGEVKIGTTYREKFYEFLNSRLIR
ncbi:MAG: LytTR family transcriptional regulator, partial [Pedobacter sp.]